MKLRVEISRDLNPRRVDGASGLLTAGEVALRWLQYIPSDARSTKLGAIPFRIETQTELAEARGGPQRCASHSTGAAQGAGARRRVGRAQYVPGCWVGWEVAVTLTATGAVASVRRREAECARPRDGRSVRFRRRCTTAP